MPTIKEAAKLFWSIKGHLNVTDETIFACYNGYYKRAWYNEEMYMHEEGFEEAWQKRIETTKSG